MSEDGRVTDPFAPPPLERGANPDQWSYFPPPGEYPAPWQPPQREPFWRWVRVHLLPHLRTFGVTTAVVVLLGAPFALLWRAVAEPAVVLRTASGPQPAAPESNQVFAVDGRFVLLSLVVGAVLGAVAWFFLRTRGPAAPAGLAAGGLLAMLVAAAAFRRAVRR